MTSSPEFIPTDVPARIADLAFSYLRPSGFHVVQIPDERPDFDLPTTFFPLQVVMANYGAVLFSAVARPAYADGTVQDWAEFLARESSLAILSLQPGVIGGLSCLTVEGVQTSEAGPMRMRTALLEDGRRLLNLSIVAPDAIWPGVEPTLQLTLASFRLAESRGTSTPLLRDEFPAGALPVSDAAAANSTRPEKLVP